MQKLMTWQADLQLFPMVFGEINISVTRCVYYTTLVLYTQSCYMRSLEVLRQKIYGRPAFHSFFHPFKCAIHHLFLSIYRYSLIHLSYLVIRSSWVTSSLTLPPCSHCVMLMLHQNSTKEFMRCHMNCLIKNIDKKLQ